MIPSGLNFRTARDERSTFNETRWYNAALMAGFCMRLSFLALIMLAACDPITKPAKNMCWPWMSSLMLTDGRLSLLRYE